MNLKDVFSAGGVVCAHVIDDAYDVIPTWQLKDEIQSFFDDAPDTDLEIVGKALTVAADEETLRGELGFAESFAKLYPVRDALTAAGKEALFGDFYRYREGKLALLKPLVDLLESMGVTCRKFGADYNLTGEPLPQLLFVDLKLKEDSPSVDHRDAVAVVKKLRSSHPNCRPFIFLMSSLELHLPQMREPFREGAELFQSEFEAIPKDKFGDEAALNLLLSANTRAMPQTGKLRESVNKLEQSLSNASQNAIKELRALDLADYFVLYHNTTSVEGTTIGSYIVELLLEFISHEIEGTDAIWELYDGIEELKVQQLPRARFGMTMPATRLYSSNMLHSKKRLIAEEGINRGPRNGYFYLGDVFCEAQWFNAPAPIKAYAVITPACDIARPESMVDNMLLCEGEVSAFTPGQIPNVRDALPVVIMPNPRGTGDPIIITWNKGNIRIWDKQERDKFKNDDCTMIRIGRLRPVYALQLQHAVTSNLSRIGTQRPPSILAPRQLRCYVVDGGKRWKLLFRSADKDDAAIAEVTIGEDAFVTYILSDPAVHKILANLSAWVADNPTADKMDILSNVTGDEIVGALQGFLQKVPKLTAKQDATAYPLAEAFPGIGKVVAFIPNRAAQTQYSTVRNASKSSKDRPVRLLFVFDDEPDVPEPPDHVPPAPAAATGLNASGVQVTAEATTAPLETVHHDGDALASPAQGTDE